ncbi:hypothetical protein HII36_35415 [Nonomuraea sp. NN258]|uniref:hypothetical protein n=1 Tax=Nonomuraea antri TaxID=2730852 RepID=UPI001568B2DC|nr:hypothetical protein [Nonomuraea antri]NRQ37089.1 hypothetical protein [Nonomuraea antri]
MGVQDALAAILSDERELALLHTDPDLLRRRHMLAEGELAMLVAARPAGLQVTRRHVVRKLRAAIGACAPVTLKHLTDRHPALWQEFAAQIVRRPPPADAPFGLAESRRMAGWLADRGLAGLACYARYEMARHTLRCDHAAARAAAATPLAAPWGAVLEVSPAARLAAFDHDVTAGPPLHELPARHTDLVLQRLCDPARVRAFTVNRATAGLMLGCDGTRTAEQVIAAGGGDQEGARSMLTALAARGLIRPRLLR